MTLEKELQIRRLVSDLRKQIDKFENDLLLLMAHPDAEDGQIAEVRTAYMDLKQRVAHLNTKLPWRVQL